MEEIISIHLRQAVNRYSSHVVDGTTTRGPSVCPITQHRRPWVAYAICQDLEEGVASKVSYNQTHISLAKIINCTFTIAETGNEVIMDQKLKKTNHGNKK